MPRDPRLYMTFPIDFDEHPKVEPLSDAAFRAFVAMNGYSRRQKLDGRIPAVVARKRWRVRELTELVNSDPERPLVLIDGDTYVIRDYAEHQFTTADEAELHERKARAGAAGGRAKARAVAGANQLPQQDLAEIGIGITTSKEVVTRKRATRLPSSFAITNDMRAWAKAETPLVDIDAKLPEFIDYWTSAANGTKTDWVATWRNGMRKQQEFAERDRPKTPKKIAPKDEWKYR
jgi:hypothetical protein